MIARTNFLIIVGFVFIFACIVSFMCGKNSGYNKGCVDTILMYEDLAAPASRKNGQYVNRYEQNLAIISKAGF